MAEEYTDNLGIPSAIEPGFDPTTNPVAIFREAMGTLSPRNVDGEPQSVKSALYKSGNYKTGPNPGNRQGNGTMDFLNDQIDYASQAGNWSRDADAYGRTYFYGAGIHGANYERYYRHPKFKELGFSPQRNNELVYNQASSWWDDFNRMSTSLGNLFMTGFKSPFDFGSKDTAREMENEMAIGMSTRGGVGGFFTNFALNTGFTLGIAAEMIAENFAIAGLTYATGGLAAAPAAAAAVGRNGMGIKKLYQLGDTISATKELLKKLTNPATAKEFYSKANGTSVLGKAVDFLNPASHTTEYARNIGKGVNGYDKLNDFAKTRKAFGAFYRDLREINLTTSESFMEGEMVSNEKNRQKIDAYYRKNGYMPQGKDAEDIYNQSRSIGFATAMANMPTIFLTNRLVFDNLFRGFKSPSVVGKELIEGTARTAQKNKNWKIGDDAFSFQERMAKNKLSKILYDNPYVPWGRKYMLGNIGEGIQEMSQEIVSSASTKYYENLYSDPAASGLYNSLVAVGQGSSEQFSMKGLETFLSGYLTGSVIQGAGAIFTSHKWAPGLYKEYFNTEEYKKEVNAQRERENQIFNAANSILKDPLGYFSENVEHALRVKQLSDGMEQAELEGDQKAFHDNKNDLQFEHLYVMARTGKMSMIEEQLDGLMQLDDQGIAEAFNQPAGESQAIRTRLGDAKQKAQQFQSTYNAFVDKYQNPFNPRMYDPEKNTAEWEKELDSYMGFESARKDAILSTVLYGKTIERMDSLLKELNAEKVVANANASDITVLLNQKLLNDEIDTLRNEINVLAEGDQKQKDMAAEKREKLDQLVQFRDMSMQYQMMLEDSRRELNEDERKARNFAVGSTVKIKRTREKVDIIKDKGDKVQVINQYGKKKTLKKSSLLPSVDVVKKQVRESNKLFYNVFTKYINTLAKQNNDNQVDKQKVIKAFLMVRDHFNLKQDAVNMMRATNMLNNPEQFMQYAQRLSEVQSVKRQNLAGYIKASYEGLSEKYGNNEFLNELFNLGMTIDPEDAEKIVYDRNYNVSLYYANTGQPVDESDPKFTEAQKVIDKYQKIEEERTANRKKEQAEEDEDEDEVVETTEGPLASAVKPEGVLDTGTKAYKDVVKLFRDLEKEKKKNGETTLGLENVSDQDLASNEDFIEFTKTNSKAMQLLKGAKSTTAVPAAEQLEELDWKPKPVPKGLEKLKNLFDKVLYLTADQKNYFDQDGILHDRVSSIKEGEDYKNVSERIQRRSQQRGNVFDKVLRELFKGSIETKADMLKIINNEIRTQKYEIQFEPDAIDQMFEIIKDIKTSVERLGWKVHSEIPVLTGEFKGLKLPQEGRVAGTIDLLIEFDGEFYIVDIKTSTMDRQSPEGKSRYMLNDTIQLNAYREMIESATGVEIQGIMIFPITVTQTGGYKTIATASAPKFDQEGLIPIPITPLRELVPGKFEQESETAAAALQPATEPQSDTTPMASTRVISASELFDLVSNATDPRSYEELKSKLYRILNGDPEFRDFFQLDAQKVKDILAQKYADLGLTFTSSDIQKGKAARLKNGEYVEIVKKTKDTFTVEPIGGGDQTTYNMSNLYDVIDNVYKDGLDAIQPPAQEVKVEESTQQISDKSVEDGQLTADKINQLNAEVTNQSQDDIDNDLLRTLCPNR